MLEVLATPKVTPFLVTIYLFCFIYYSLFDFLDACMHEYLLIPSLHRSFLSWSWDFFISQIIFSSTASHIIYIIRLSHVLHASCFSLTFLFCRDFFVSPSLDDFLKRCNEEDEQLAWLKFLVSLVGFSMVAERFEICNDNFHLICLMCGHLLFVL